MWTLMSFRAPWREQQWQLYWRAIGHRRRPEDTTRFLPSPEFWRVLDGLSPKPSRSTEQFIDVYGKIPTLPPPSAKLIPLFNGTTMAMMSWDSRSLPNQSVNEY